jgi:protein-tyrosine-phosphatase/DNA-binding transcriptional ArsR family regulator
LQLIADPQRFRLLSELACSDHRVNELSRLLGQPQNLVSYHLRELRDVGLVSSRRSSSDRRDSYYRVDLERCAEVLATAGTGLDPGLRLSPAPARLPPDNGRISRVLFLCTGNSARSQMAEALLERLSEHTIRADSAGSHPKPLHPNAVRVMARRGIDLSRQRSKHLDGFAGTHFDQVITLCDKVREVCPEFPGQPITAHWSIPDPAAGAPSDEGAYPAFEAVGADIELRVRRLIARISAT